MYPENGIIKMQTNSTTQKTIKTKPSKPSDSKYAGKQWQRNTDKRKIEG